MRQLTFQIVKVVLCFRWVDYNFNIHEDFVGMYTIEAVDADTLVSIMHDVLQRLNLTMSQVRGQCYDGKATTSGYKSGVATQLLQEEPRAIHTLLWPCPKPCTWGYH